MYPTHHLYSQEIEQFSDIAALQTTEEERRQVRNTTCMCTCTCSIHTLYMWYMANFLGSHHDQLAKRSQSLNPHVDVYAQYTVGHSLNA